MTPGPVFLVPMRSEFAAVRLGAPKSEIVRIGMGPERAQSASKVVAQRFGADQPLVLAGVCGGLSADLKCGDVLIASSVGLLSSDDSVALQNTDVVAAALSSLRHRVQIASLVSSPRILHGDTQRSEAGANGALAVDMESYWCATALSGRPLVIVRVVLDGVGDALFSPRMAGAVTKAFTSLRSVVRTLASCHMLSPTNSFQEVGEN